MAKSKKNVKKQEALYYFYSVGCGFCKKSEPIVDELNKEGYNILKLDLAEPDNQGLNNELKQKYGKQCGTPWFINADTGNAVCGYREKDVIKKWADGEEVPEPPRPKGPMPRPPFLGAPEKEENKWKEDYKKWAEENSHLPNLQTAEQILESPRPKSEPPSLPAPSSNDETLDKFKDDYNKWKDENSHLPNLQPAETIIARLKQQPIQAPPGAPPVAPQSNPVLEKRIDNLEAKLDRLLQHLGVPTPPPPPPQPQVVAQQQPKVEVEKKEVKDKAKSTKKGK